MFTRLDLAVVLLYLVGIMALGLRQAARIRHTGDYFAGGRTFNKWLMMMHSLGTGTHADDPVGVVGAAYQHGYSGIWYTYVYLFATPFYWLIAPVFRRSRFLTTADLFEARLGRGLGRLYAVMGVVIFAINTGTLLKGTELITTAVTHGRVPAWVSILVMTVVFVAYGTAGGLLATVVVESVQGLLIIVMSLLLLPYGLHAVGGLKALHTTLAPSYFSLQAPQELTPVWILAASVAMLIGIVAQPHIMEVCAAGKTEWEGRVGFTYGNFVKRFCALGWAMTGVIVAALVAQGGLTLPGGHRELAFGAAIARLLPPGATGLMFAALLAAQMSTLSAFMVAGSALLARNLYQGWWLPTRGGGATASDEQVLRIGRWAGLLVVGLGVAFAFCVEGVAQALTFFWALNAMMGLFMWAAVLWRPTNAVGCWLSYAVMLPLWLLTGPPGLALHRLLGLSWLGCYGDKGQLPWLLLAYLPAGLAALVCGSVWSTVDESGGQRRPEARRWEALGGCLLGGLLLVPLGPASWLTCGAALVASALGWALRGGRDEAALDRFYQLLRTPVGRESELTDAGVEMVYAGRSEGHPWELEHPRVVAWGGFAAALLFSGVILGLLAWLASLGG